MPCACHVSLKIFVVKFYVISTMHPAGAMIRKIDRKGTFCLKTKRRVLPVENQKGVTAVSVMFCWEPEGRYCCSVMLCWEPEGRYCCSVMFCWEPEGRYCCFSDVLLRTRRVLSLYKVYGNSALLVLTDRTSLKSPSGSQSMVCFWTKW